MTKVSIILPVYNGEKYLRTAIKSILNQSFEDFELILVNDASTDRTLDIIQFFATKDKRIKVISNQENKKLPASLNVGFAEATGAYLTWTSDDNALMPDCIERLLAELIKRDVDIIYADVEEINEHGDLTTIMRRDKPIEYLLHTNVVGACFLYRREVQERLEGYREYLFLIEDYDFWCRAYLQNFRFHHLKEILYSYRRHTQSLSLSYTERVSFYRLQYIIKTMRGIDNQALKNQILGEVFSIYKGFYWAPAKIDGSSPQQALEHFQKQIKASPLNLFNYHATAQLFSAANDYAAAEAVLKDILDVFPYWENGVMLLLDIYLKQNKIDAAIALIQNAAAIDDQNDTYKKILLTLLKHHKGS